jgi:hypothetical protein
VAQIQAAMKPADLEEAGRKMEAMQVESAKQ